jgi:hypothetical protein
MDNGTEFKTRDLSLASGISLQTGKDPSFEADHRGNVVFKFHGSDEIRQAAAAFIDGSATGSLIDYSERLKNIRSMMFHKRDLAGRREIPTNGVEVMR